MSLEKLNVLIVDDNLAGVAIFICSFEFKLNNWTDKCHVVIDDAYDVDSALDLVNKKKYDFIISDISMPGKTGFDFCMELKAIGCDAFLVAYSSDEAYERAAINVGFDLFFYKNDDAIDKIIDFFVKKYLIQLS